MKNSRTQLIVGQNAKIKIPHVDRGRNCPHNVIAVIMDRRQDALYRLGVHEGILEKLYSRNEFHNSRYARNHFLQGIQSLFKMPLHYHLSLRKAAATVIGRQKGFVNCNFNGKCDSKRCHCVKHKVLCNSKWQNSGSCKNK